MTSTMNTLIDKLAEKIGVGAGKAVPIANKTVEQYVAEQKVHGQVHFAMLIIAPLIAIVVSIMVMHNPISKAFGVDATLVKATAQSEWTTLKSKQISQYSWKRVNPSPISNANWLISITQVVLLIVIVGILLSSLANNTRQLTIHVANARSPYVQILDKLT